MSRTRKSPSSDLIPAERIENSILLIRGDKVMIDADLAELYGVQTGHLVRAVKRNLDRFPDDFMFQLSDEEWETLRCQSGISNVGKGGRRRGRVTRGPVAPTIKELPGSCSALRSLPYITYLLV